MLTLSWSIKKKNLWKRNESLCSGVGLSVVTESVCHGKETKDSMMYSLCSTEQLSWITNSGSLEFLTVSVFKFQLKGSFLVMQLTGNSGNLTSVLRERSINVGV